MLEETLTFVLVFKSTNKIVLVTQRIVLRAYSPVEMIKTFPLIGHIPLSFKLLWDKINNLYSVT